MIEPMKAVLADTPFSDPDWIFERKLDGIRCLATRDASGVRLVSRTGRRMNHEYPTIVEALEREASDDFIADGEIVAFENGITSFSRLQRRGRERVPVFLYLFDLPRHAGEDLRRLPLRQRKRLLRSLRLRRAGAHQPPPQQRARRGHLPRGLRQGLEGLIAKRADSVYRPRRPLARLAEAEVPRRAGARDRRLDRAEGSRTGSARCSSATTTTAGRSRYAGKVGTGFDHRTLADLGARIREARAGRVAVRRPVREPGAHWVRPELVAQIGFSEWTRDGRLRHPRYLGPARRQARADVVREEPS